MTSPATPRDGYLAVLREPGVARVIAAQLTARMPSGMLTLALVIHAETILGSYASAGLVLAALSTGQAVAGPLTSRWMGRWGVRPVLWLTVAVCAAALTVLALAPLELAGMMTFAAIAGLSTPPIQPAVRTLYPRMVNASQLNRIFSLDATAQELIWVTGPVVATLLAVQISSRVAILVAVGFLLTGGVWFITSKPLARIRIPRTSKSFGAVLRQPTVLLMTVIGVVFVASFSAIEVGVVAVFGDHGPESGIVLAIFSVGSLIGGLWFGHRPVTPWALARRVLIVAVGAGLTLVMLDFWWLAAVLFIAGFGIAPALAAMFMYVSSSVKFSQTAEAFGWAGTGQLMGAAVGAAVAGFAIDGVGPVGAFWTALGSLTITFVLLVVCRSAQPDLSKRDIGPAPDTTPVSTIG